jgi:hypothetical protein
LNSRHNEYNYAVYNNIIITLTAKLIGVAEQALVYVYMKNENSLFKNDHYHGEHRQIRKNKN